MIATKLEVEQIHTVASVAVAFIASETLTSHYWFTATIVISKRNSVGPASVRVSFACGIS